MRAPGTIKNMLKDSLKPTGWFQQLTQKWTYYYSLGGSHTSTNSNPSWEIGWEARLVLFSFGLHLPGPMLRGSPVWYYHFRNYLRVSILRRCKGCIYLTPKRQTAVILPSFSVLRHLIKWCIFPLFVFIHLWQFLGVYARIVRARRVQVVAVWPLPLLPGGHWNPAANGLRMGLQSRNPFVANPTGPVPRHAHHRGCLPPVTDHVPPLHGLPTWAREQCLARIAHRMKWSVPTTTTLFFIWPYFNPPQKVLWSISWPKFFLMW